MRTIITGSREIDNIRVVRKAIEASHFSIDEVVSGTERGVDRLSELWAAQHGVRVKKVPPEGLRFGAPAGIQRNRRMTRGANALIVVWDGKDREMLRLIRHARRRGMKVYVHRVG